MTYLNLLQNLNWYFQTMIIYLVFINLITFFVYGLDKWKANLQTHRISEKTLWLLALVGGSVGALTGMNLFRHKTKKASFQAVLIIILLTQLVLFFGCWGISY